MRGADGKFTKGDAATAPAAPAEAKLVKLLNGKELSFDEVVRLATKQAGGEDKFREASEERKATQADKAKIDALLSALGDPARFAKDLAAFAKEKGNIDPQKLATAILQPLIDAEIAAAEEKTLSPEQLEARKLRRENEEFRRSAEESKKARETEEQTKKQAEHDAQVTKLQDDYANQVVATMEKMKAPRTAEFARDVVGVIKKLVQDGVTVDGSLVEAIVGDMVTSERARSLAIQEASGDQSWVSPKILEAARKAAIEKLKTPMSGTKPIVGKREPKTEVKDTREGPDAVKRRLMMRGR